MSKERGARATLPLAFILHFFTALLLVAVLIAWIAECKVQAQNGDSNNHVMQDGLWICSMQFRAADFDDKVWETSKNGVTLTYTVVEQLAKQNECKRLNADNIKPIGLFIQNATSGRPYQLVRVSDGKQEDWSPLDMYVAYMRFHVVRKPDAK